MEKGVPSSLFVNDGSFMERFKQLQQQKDEKDKATVLEESKPPKVVKGSSAPKPSFAFNKVAMERKTAQTPSGGKLAFSLKQKSKLIAPPVKLGADEDEEDQDAGKLVDDKPIKKQKLDRSDASEHASKQVDVGNYSFFYIVLLFVMDGTQGFYLLSTPSPSDLTVKNVADKLASFVAKNGRQLNILLVKKTLETHFHLLRLQYYAYRLAEEEKALSQNKEQQTPQSASKSTSSSIREIPQQSSYQTPASALYDNEEPRSSVNSVGRAGSSSAPAGSDPIAMMEFYMKKAAQEEKRRMPKQSKDEMPPPPSLQGESLSRLKWVCSCKEGHHMGDYIPQEELEKFLAACNDAAAQKAAKETAQKAKIQSDNVGHKLLSKMGWKEGDGLGSSRNGISNPIMAGDVKMNNLGVGAQNPGEVTAEDDIYEQYKKRMMLGYRHRPNPLNNPRKAYY
ncbi:SURP and G-patch domain-containing protein 1-like protein [Hibiscus syriacus]|uniref:SURP and G-patch domain-containing protein 1-like protein n=1 Tax=Hibiscus syriacus TaxID=106335 RepID=A0A6A2X9L6_HIBSY|nr:SURP and G-patch domain-containing protein 1-like protein [Hibiscus syriacus]